MQARPSGGSGFKTTRFSYGVQEYLSGERTGATPFAGRGKMGPTATWVLISLPHRATPAPANTRPEHRALHRGSGDLHHTGLPSTHLVRIPSTLCAHGALVETPDVRFGMVTCTDRRQRETRCRCALAQPHSMRYSQGARTRTFR